MEIPKAASQSSEEEQNSVSPINSRRRAREAALQVLYQCDTHTDWSASSIHRYFEVFHKLEVATIAAREGALRYCLELIEGVVMSGTKLDSMIDKASPKWSLRNMGQVERNILRLACYEICFVEDVPFNVSVNESIELAKRFASFEAGRFVNNVLSRIGDEVKLSSEYTLALLKLDSNARSSR